MVLAPKRSTLAYANAHRPWQLYERLSSHLLARRRELGPGKKFRLRNRLVSLDSSTVELCASMFDWATWRRARVRSNSNRSSTTTDACCAVTELRSVPSGGSGFRDEAICLKASMSGRPDDADLRRIVVWLEDQQEELVPLTNNFRLAVTQHGALCEDTLPDPEIDRQSLAALPASGSALAEVRSGFDDHYRPQAHLNPGDWRAGMDGGVQIRFHLQECKFPMLGAGSPRKTRRRRRVGLGLEDAHLEST